MKPSYKLIGAHWDNLPQAEALPVLIPFEEDALSLETSRNLFDGVRYRRVISLAKLLSFANSKDIDAYLSLGRECDEIVVLIDFHVRSAGTVPKAFFERRLRQVMQRVTDALPTATILLMRTNEERPAA